MTLQDIADMRLSNMQFISTRFSKPHELISYMGALQAQDYLSAKWAVGMRLPRTFDKDVEEAMNEGTILRTHILRPTWHFVAPQDIRWMQMVSSPRVHRFNAYYYKQQGVTPELMEKANIVLRTSLANHTYLTRDELVEKFEAGDVPVRELQRQAYILIHAELDSLICSGPRVGKQFTYALMDERVPKMQARTMDEPLLELTLRYFTSHGPATVKDMTWWSGLATQDIIHAITSLQHKLVSYEVAGLTYYASSQSTRENYRKPLVSLQPAYDEYTVAYKHHEAHFPEVFKREELGYGYFIIINGQIAGTWKREVKKNTIAISFKPFRKLTSEEDLELRKQADRYGKFVGLPVQME